MEHVQIIPDHIVVLVTQVTVEMDIQAIAQILTNVSTPLTPTDVMSMLTVQIRHLADILALATMATAETVTIAQTLMSAQHLELVTKMEHVQIIPDHIVVLVTQVTVEMDIQ